MKTLLIAIFFIGSFQMLGQDSFNKEFLQRINELRLHKNVKPLIYDEELYRIAKKWGQFLLRQLKPFSDSSIIAKANIDKQYLHIQSDERFDAILKKDYILSIAENLYLEMDTKPVDDIVSSAFAGWNRSSSHYMQMMSTEETHVAYYNCYDPIRKRYMCISVYAEKKPSLDSKKK